MKLFILAMLISSSLLASDMASGNLSKLKEIKTLTHFAFGSCNKEWKKQPLWKNIIADSPQLFLWGGDNIYGDKGPNKDKLSLKYLIQNNQPDYQALKKQTPIIGIWDDHDYGANNGNDTYSGKYLSQQLFLDFIAEPTNSPRRSQEGIYTSYTFGEKEKQVKFILLDNRFHLTDKKLKNPSILGEKQWQWLENELKKSKAKIHFIVSGIPFLPNKMVHTEEWADYPQEKERLFNLLKKYKTSGVIFLSGDKHFAAISEKEGFVEVMSSGLTHKTHKVLIPWLKTKFPKSYFGLNYGLIAIEWGKTPIIDVQIKGVEKTALHARYKIVKKFLTNIKIK